MLYHSVTDHPYFSLSFTYGDSAPRNLSFLPYGLFTEVFPIRAHVVEK